VLIRMKNKSNNNNTPSLPKNSSKFFILVIALIVFIVFSVALLVYTIPKNRVSEIDGYKLPSENLYYTKGISLFECLEDKGKVIELCEKDKESCVLSLMSVYIIYLHKTSQPDKFESVEHRLPAQAMGSDLTREQMLQDIRSSLRDENYKSEYFNEFYLIKFPDFEEAIKLAGKDTNLELYFKNIVVYSNAEKIDDCGNINIGEEVTNLMSILLKDACELTFTKDKEKHCKDALKDI